MDKIIRNSVSTPFPADIKFSNPGVILINESMPAGNNVLLTTLGAFAFVGLLIARIGLYRVMTRLTHQRTREIDVRIALSTGRRDTFALILGHGARLIGVDVLLRLLGAYAVGRIFQQTMPELALPGIGLQGCNHDAARQHWRYRLLLSRAPRYRSRSADGVAR